MSDVEEQIIKLAIFGIPVATVTWTVTARGSSSRASRVVLAKEQILRTFVLEEVLLPADL
jgi:hypothetical protein